MESVLQAVFADLVLESCPALAVADEHEAHPAVYVRDQRRSLDQVTETLLRTEVRDGSNDRKFAAAMRWMKLAFGKRR